MDMTAVEHSPHRSPFDNDRNADLPSRTLPLLSTTSASPMSHRSEPMDTSADNAISRGPHANDSPRGGQGGLAVNVSERDGHQNGTPGPPVGAAAAAQQPKAISAAFIHKLYRYEPHTVVAIYRSTWLTLCVACSRIKAFST